ncbi:MAG: ATP-binding protein, partial [Candidatus Omnitrophota bacterium]
NEAIRLLYNELEIKNTELKKLDQLKSDFVSTVSHELRTPLSIIKEGINLILDEITGKINEKQNKYLSIARQNVDRLERIINDLLNISKIESGKMKLKKQSVFISELIKNVTDSFKPKLKETGIKFKLNLPKKDVEIYVDPDRIMQVFVNLIGNALKFTKEGHIEISVEGKGQEIECAISDTGIGIAKEDLPRVFTKFRQFGRQDGPGERGTGLGLVISKGIIEMHKGNIWVDSTLGKGTSFVFTIPKHAPDEKKVDEES